MTGVRLTLVSMRGWSSDAGHKLELAAFDTWVGVLVAVVLAPLVVMPLLGE